MSTNITPEALQRALAAACKAGEYPELPSRVYDALIAGWQDLQGPQSGPSYGALHVIVGSIAGALERAGITDCDDPGEAIDLMRERYERRIAELLAAQPPHAWPERYGCNGPEGTFWTDDAALANKLIAATFDRDDWTVTDMRNPVAAQPDELHQHLLDMLGAKDHADAGRIIGELHAAKLASPAAAGVPDALCDLYVSASRGFHITETCGPDGKYQHVSKFRSIADLHAFSDAWRAAMISVRDASAVQPAAQPQAEHEARVQRILASFGPNDWHAREAMEKALKTVRESALRMDEFVAASGDPLLDAADTLQAALTGDAAQPASSAGGQPVATKTAKTNGERLLELSRDLTAGFLEAGEQLELGRLLYDAALWPGNPLRKLSPAGVLCDPPAPAAVPGTCPHCAGTGEMEVPMKINDHETTSTLIGCDACAGSGVLPQPAAQGVDLAPDTFFLIDCPGWPGGLPMGAMHAALDYVRRFGDAKTRISTWKEQAGRRDYSPEEVRAMLDSQQHQQREGGA